MTEKINSSHVSQYQAVYDRAYKKYLRSPNSEEGKKFLKQAIEAQIAMADLFPDSPEKPNPERIYHARRADELLSVLESSRMPSASFSKEQRQQEQPEPNCSESEEAKKAIDSIRIMEKPETTFQDIKGLEHTKQKLSELCMHENPRQEIYKYYGVTLPRKFLFYGPPGTGKTMLAQAFANAMFKEEEDFPFFLVEGKDLINCYIGETAKAISTLFHEARKYPRSVIFMDDADSFLRSRKLLEKSDEIRNMTTLLTELDGFCSKTDHAIIICATNNPEAIDDAALGRFDQIIEIPLPDEEARRCMICDSYLNTLLPNLSDRMIEKLVTATENYNGRDIKNLCQKLIKSFCDTLPEGCTLPYPGKVPDLLLQNAICDSSSSVDLSRVEEMHLWAHRS